MRKRRRNFPILILSFLTLGVLLYLVFNFPPGYQFNLNNLLFPILPLFFTLLFLFFFFFFGFLFANSRQGFFLSLLLSGILFLYFIKLNNPFFIGTLIVLFAIEELFFLKRR